MIHLYSLRILLCKLLFICLFIYLFFYNIESKKETCVGRKFGNNKVNYNNTSIARKEKELSQEKRDFEKCRNFFVESVGRKAIVECVIYAI